MRFELCQNLQLSQKLSLSCKIELGKLMSVPDKIVQEVLESLVSRASLVEGILNDNSQQQSHYLEGKVRSVYNSFSEGNKSESKRQRNGVALTPNAECLVGHLGDELELKCLDILPDVKFIGRKHEAPIIVFSEHLVGNMKLQLLQVDSSKYPKVTKLLAQLRRFDVWKRGMLTNVYIALRDVQREFFEEFDSLKLQIFSQDMLAEKLGVNSSTISRLIKNRFVEVTSISGKSQYFRLKDLLITQHKKNKIFAIYKLNAIMANEFQSKEARSDVDIVKLVPHIKVRTLAKYRKESGIPTFSKRRKIYREGELQSSFKFNAVV